MKKDWRSSLFKPPQDQFSLNSLGFPLSQTKGSQMLGICPRTWRRWESIAVSIPEYKLQQIKLKKIADAAGAIAPIVPYQVWVVGKIGEIFENLPHGLAKKWMAQEYINGKKEEFTREAYQKELTQFLSLALTA
ncbi:MAG: hypothetical protein AB1589_30910 [Cyanobacteriota bacterium]